MVTLVHLRTGLTHEAWGVLYEVGSSTIGRAIREVRSLLADCGFAVPDRPGIRLRTLQWCLLVSSGSWCEGCRRAMTFTSGPGPLPAWRAPEKKVRPLLPSGGTYR
nr:transposase family protein [Streptomyces sp. SID12488]